MIAIFAPKDFIHEIDFLTKKTVKRIRSVEDVRGRTFTGVIVIREWFTYNKEIQDAYDILTARQPDLFND